MNLSRFLITSFIILIVVIVLIVYANALTIEFEKTYGGTENDRGHSVQQTSDGGFIITGWKNRGSYSDIGSDFDVYLIKTDGNGNLLWDRTFGGTEADSGSSVLQTFDGGYTIAGWTTSFGASDEDIYFIKTDANGNTTCTDETICFEKYFGSGRADEAHSVQQTDDDGYIIAAHTNAASTGNDVYIIKTDEYGNITWENYLRGPGGEGGFSVQQTSDSGYIIAGMTNSKGAVGIILEEAAEPEHLERWNLETGDVRFNSGISKEIMNFIKTHGARSVAITDKIIGCPHEEGIDYPEGEVCPHCPYWAHRDRWTG